MKTILNGSGVDVTATTSALLKSNRNLIKADLFHLTMLGGAQSRNAFGFVARWTDRDYPIHSSMLNRGPINNIWWPPGFSGTGLFYPQRVKRGGITQKVGLTSDTFELEVYLNSSLNSAVQSIGGPLSPPAGNQDLSIASYRDAFTLSTVDFLTVAETLSQAAWKGELEGMYIFIFRGIMASDNGDVDTLGVFPLFTGYVSEYQVSRLSVKFSVTSLVDYFTTTHTPTQVIQNHDRGGDDIISLAASHLTSTVQSGSTSLMLIGDGGAPPNLVEVDGEQQQIPPVGPFTVMVVNAATFNGDLGVVFADTGVPLISVGGSPGQGQYNVNSGTGVYTFNSNDKTRGVLISYTYNAALNGVLANGILIYQYGSQFKRPLDSLSGTQRVIREIYTNTFTGGLNHIYLFEPLPVPPTPSSDTFTAYQPSAFDSAQSVNGKGFPFVAKPESVL